MTVNEIAAAAPTDLTEQQTGVQAALSVMGERIGRRAPNMVLTSSYIPPAAVACSYLLNRLLSVATDAPTEWRSVFTNSGLESLATVLKFVKNRNNRLLDGRREHIAVLDRTGHARHALGLTVPRLHAAARGNVVVCDDIEEFLALGGTVGATTIIIGDGITPTALESVLARVRADAQRHALCAVGVLSDYALLPRLRSLGQTSDIVFLGEVLSRQAVPVGAVSIRQHAFSLWSNPVDSIAHISTFGCNGLAMDLACQTLESQTGLHSYDHSAVDAITANDRIKQARQRMHGNPWQARSIELAGLNFRFVSADGVTYQCDDGPYVDLGSGAGTAFRGHNQITDLPTVHALDGATARLETELADLTGLPIMLPAVSGASSVDKAVLAALAARSGRPAVVTAAGNFSGKGTLSVALSKTSSFFRDRDSDAFAPHPFKVIECPLDDPQAWADALGRDDVALVWMEPALGVDCVAIPQQILDLVAQHRARSGYLVGFDECFTGFWRGDNTAFLMSRALGQTPDVVAIAKSMSDGLVPIGAVLLAEHVHNDIRAHAPELAEWLRTTHASDFTAHFALHALQVGRRDAADNSALVQALEDCLRAAESSPVFDASARIGLLGRLTLTDRLGWLTQSHTLKEYLEAVVSRRIADHCRTITLQMRVVPSTAGRDHERITAALGDMATYLADFTFADLARGVARSVIGSAAREVLIAATQRHLAGRDAAAFCVR